MSAFEGFAPRSVVREAKWVLRVSRSDFWSIEEDFRRSEVVSHWLISACSVSLYLRLVKEDIVLKKEVVGRMARGRMRVGNSLTVCFKVDWEKKRLYWSHC